MSSLDEHARALGYLCISWGQLETHLDLLLGTLLFAQQEKPLQAYEAKVASCVTANIRDLRNKTRMVHSVGYLRRPDDDWFSHLEYCMNNIDQLRDKRNRMVHDVWIVGVNIGADEIDVLRRRISGTKITKPQSHMRELVTNETSKVSVAEITAVRDEIRDTIAMLTVLLGNFLHPKFLPWTWK